jgi:hypothetical protein
MAVHHRLPGGCTGIKPGIVPGRTEILLDYFSAVIDQGKQGKPLLNRHREEIRSMPVKHQEQVAQVPVFKNTRAFGTIFMKKRMRITIPRNRFPVRIIKILHQYYGPGKIIE